MKSLPLDEILYETWLMVCQLRNGWVAEEGRVLYRTACAQVDNAKQALSEAGISADNIDHILYAQCALLDSAVMSRNTEDAGYHEWLNNPLQSKYFNTLGAGDQLWERIRGVLREPAPDSTVLTCFHRVLHLGFSGRYADEQDPDREAVLQALNQRVPPFVFPPQTAAVALPATRRYRIGAGAARSWWWRLFVVAALLGGLWWVLDLNLQRFVTSQFAPQHISGQHINNQQTR